MSSGRALSLVSPLRRSAVSAVLAVLCAVSLSAEASAAKSRQHRRAPSPAAAQLPAGPIVDVTRLRELGLGALADSIKQHLSADLAVRDLANRAGGRVVVRLTGLSLASYAGSDGGGGGSNGGGGGTGAVSDYLDGEILVVGPRGEILSSRPQLVSLAASSGGAYYLPGFEERRIAALTQAYAAWAARSL